MCKGRDHRHRVRVDNGLFQKNNGVAEYSANICADISDVLAVTEFRQVAELMESALLPTSGYRFLFSFRFFHLEGVNVSRREGYMAKRPEVSYHAFLRR